MPHKLALRQAHAALTLSGLLLGACLVQDVELVDHLPGDANGGSGGASASGGMAGSSSSSGAQHEGGHPGGGEAGGEDDGGAAGASSGGVGGSIVPGGGGGTGGSGGSTTHPDIPPNLLDCNTIASPYVCDTFEQQLAPEWPPGTAAGEVVDAPSGKLGLIVDYTNPHSLPVDLTAMSVSFWVRFPSPTDQRFLSFQNATTLQEFGLGIEHDRARWIYPDETTPVVAPELNTLTQILPVDTWVCVQIRADLFANTFDATAVVPGDPPIVLPVLDSNPTTGEDETWNNTYAGWTSNSQSIIFGQVGVYQEIDDVLVAEYDVETLCEKFVALGN